MAIASTAKSGTVVAGNDITQHDDEAGPAARFDNITGVVCSHAIDDSDIERCRSRYPDVYNDSVDTIIGRRDLAEDACIDRCQSAEIINPCCNWMSLSP